MLDKAKALKKIADARALAGALSGDGDTMLALGKELAELEALVNAA
jgi:homoserine kinase